MKKKNNENELTENEIKLLKPFVNKWLQKCPSITPRPAKIIDVVTTQTWFRAWILNSISREVRQESASLIRMLCEVCFYF